MKWKGTEKNITTREKRLNETNARTRLSAQLYNYSLLAEVGEPIARPVPASREETVCTARAQLCALTSDSRYYSMLFGRRLFIRYFSLPLF